MELYLKIHTDSVNLAQTIQGYMLRRDLFTLQSIVRSVLVYNWHNYQTSTSLTHLHCIYPFRPPNILHGFPSCDSEAEILSRDRFSFAEPFSSSFSTTNPTTPTPPFPQSSHNHHNGSRSKYNRYFTIGPSAAGAFGTLAAGSIPGLPPVRRPTSRVNS